MELTRAERSAGMLTDHFFGEELRKGLRHLQEAAAIMSLEPPGSHELDWLKKIQVSVSGVAKDLGEEAPVYIRLSPEREEGGEAVEHGKNGHVAP